MEGLKKVAQATMEANQSKLSEGRQNPFYYWTSTKFFFPFLPGRDVASSQRLFLSLGEERGRLHYQLFFPLSPPLLHWKSPGKGKATGKEVFRRERPQAKATSDPENRSLSCSKGNNRLLRTSDDNLH